MSDKKEVASVFSTNLNDLPQGSGLGNEDLTAEDMKIPTLKLLQKMSEEMSEGNPKYNPDARPGMWVNTVTGEVMKEAYVVNLKFTPHYTLKNKHGEKGGFIGTFASEEQAEAHVASLGESLEDFKIVLGHKHTIMLVDPVHGSMGLANLYMSSSAMPVSRGWNSRIEAEAQKAHRNDADRFMSIWKLTSATQSNSLGSWSVPSVDFAGWAKPALYEQALAAYTKLFGGDAAKAA